MKIYNEKLVQSGNMCELYTYFSIKKTGYTRNYAVKKSKTGIKKQINLNRTKKLVKRYFYSNFDHRFTKFITLTFDPKQFTDISLNDLSSVIPYYLKFIRKLKKIKKNLKYMTIVELQDNGNIHFHIVCDIHSKIKFEKLLNMWGYGFVHVENITCSRKAVYYLTKYITKFKELPEHFLNKKLFFRSRNLLNSIVSYILNTRSDDYTHKVGTLISTLFSLLNSIIINC